MWLSLNFSRKNRWSIPLLHEREQKAPKLQNFVPSILLNHHPTILRKGLSIPSQNKPSNLAPQKYLAVVYTNFDGSPWISIATHLIRPKHSSIPCQKTHSIVSVNDLSFLSTHVNPLLTDNTCPSKNSIGYPSPSLSSSPNLFKVHGLALPGDEINPSSEDSISLMTTDESLKLSEETKPLLAVAGCPILTACDSLDPCKNLISSARHTNQRWAEAYCCILLDLHKSLAQHMDDRSGII